MLVLGFGRLGLFCEKSPICKGFSTSVERQEGGDGLNGEDRRPNTEDGRRNPGVVGMGVLLVGLSSISKAVLLVI